MLLLPLNSANDPGDPGFEAQGAKEVRDAVITSALITLATGLINWGIDTAKRRAEERRKKREEEARKAKSAAQAS